MIRLLESYTLAQILFVVVTLALAIKGAVDFWEWQSKHFWHTVNGIKTKEKQEEQVHYNTEDIQIILDELNKINDKISLLMLSDKEDIKNFIIEKHKVHCYEIGWIDEYTLDCLEKRYGYYKNEGGNSFVYGLMSDIRALPKTPPKEK